MKAAVVIAALLALFAKPFYITPDDPPVVPGVAEALAEERAQQVSNILYRLRFEVSTDQNEPIPAIATLTFTLVSGETDLQLDFSEAAENLRSVSVNGTETPPDHRAEHLVLPASLLRMGQNVVTIEFIAGDSSLNRNPDYLYTLFVPDRARTAFPLFDQPNLKARYDLTLDLPAGWKALANAPLEASETVGERTVHHFATSDLIPPYLFSFVAGNFEEVERTVRGRRMRFLHRETDQEKVARNLDAIFDLHADSLEWLEDYTGIPYPFQKFDFVAIPSFQYGGMEHVGAIQYPAETLFLDEAPSEQQLLSRAEIIAHESAHMWFGNLVTMNWFNDVWTKEVFANFIAAKIIEPSFPNVDHDLSFLLRNYPAAYSVDRTAGANPIRQSLPNLNEAGTLYGPIIYNKAPIMMRQLEMIVGEDALREGIQEYLTTFANGNATWPELVAILDKKTEVDLANWSRTWVESSGRPTFFVNPETGYFGQSDPSGEGRVWRQRFSLLGREQRDVEVGSSALNLGGSTFLFNSDGRGYGLFPVDPTLIAARWAELSDLQKGAQIVNLQEQMLDGHPEVSPRSHFDFLVNRLGTEDNELLLGTMLRQAADTFWRFLPEETRDEDARTIEAVLWARLNDETLPASTRKSYFRTLSDVALSTAMLDILEAVWEGERTFPGINLSEREQTELAAIIAIKRPARSRELLAAQLQRLENPDDQRRLVYLMPSLSDDPAVREAFFTSLADEDARTNENWVLSALRYLHHPLRTDHSRQMVLPSLELLEEVQATGDIFFPEFWAQGNLSNHTSQEVAATIRQFLAERPDYNHQLRLKILQASDPVFRAARLNP